MSAARLLAAIVAERLRILDGIVGDAAEEPVLELVVVEVVRRRAAAPAPAPRPRVRPAPARARSRRPRRRSRRSAKSTVLGVAITFARSFVSSGVDGEARIVAVVVAERRLEDVLVFEAEQLPADAVAIAAVFGIANMPSSVSSRVVLEERRALDSLSGTRSAARTTATRTTGRPDARSRDAA